MCHDAWFLCNPVPAFMRLTCKVASGKVWACLVLLSCLCKVLDVMHLHAKSAVCACASVGDLASLGQCMIGKHDVGVLASKFFYACKH